jgi:hypothetical protein
MTDTQPLNILITTPQWQSALACIQSLGRAGHKIFVWSELKNHPHLESTFVSQRIQKNSQKIEDQILELEAVITKYLVDFVIPVSDSDAFICAKYNEERKSKKCLVGALEAVSIARDRNRTANLCRSASLPFPKSAPAIVLTAEKVADGIGYPCFIKLSGTVASQGVKKIKNREELRSHLSKLPQFLPFQIQQEVRGRFVGTTGVSYDGALIDVFSFETDYRHSHGGNPPYAQELRDDRAAHILGTVVKHLNWTGGIDLDLLQDVDGNYYILEINPRLSGTTVFPYKLGIDLPGCYVDIFSRWSTGRPVNSDRRFVDSHKSTSRFVSILEEAFFLRGAGHDDRNFSRWFRRDDLWYDNSFWDDPGYSRALFETTRQILLPSDPVKSGVMKSVS